ncbi:MAG: hypothetical protein ISS74_06990 [Planctomycetes bacterium]|nr:hypothetical protein [Planctomycetota bacterium]
MRTFLLSVLLLAIFSAAACAQGTFPLKRQEAEMTSPTVRMAQVVAAGVPTCPPDLKGAPDAANTDNRYYRLPLGEGGRYAAILPAAEGQTGIRLLLDTDGDNDLSDETAVAGTQEKTLVTFPAATLSMGPGQTVTVRAIGPTPDPKRPPQYLILMPAAYLTATVKLGGKDYSLALVDTNMNGRFNDTLTLPLNQRQTDSLSIDLNGNGAFDTPRTQDDVFEMFPLAKGVKVGDTYFDVKVTDDGTKVTFTKAEPKFGTLDLGSAGFQMLALSEYGYQNIQGTDGKARVPAGRYGAMVLALAQKDASGTEWKLQASRPTGQLADFTVPADAALAVEVGPPLVAKVDARKRGEGVQYLTLSLQGRAGEAYTPGVVKGNERAAPPSFEIVSDADKVLQTGTFEYG